MNWQPIKTAPKNGNEILLGAKDGSIAVGRWDDAENSFISDGGYDAFWATHWMPLPPPPNER